MTDLIMEPCPLCSGRATVMPHISHGKTRYSIYCRVCDLETAQEYHTPTEAITAWNTRPIEYALRKVIEQLKKEGKY